MPETGKTLWMKQVGQPQYPSMAPDANRDLLAVVTARGCTCSIASTAICSTSERSTTRPSRPVLSAKRVYIPMNNGKLVAYRLMPPDEAKRRTRRRPRKRPQREEGPGAEEKTPADTEHPETRRLHQQLAAAGVLPILWASRGAARHDAAEYQRRVHRLADRSRLLEHRHHQPDRPRVPDGQISRANRRRDCRSARLSASRSQGTGRFGPDRCRLAQMGTCM